MATMRQELKLWLCTGRAQEGAGLEQSSVQFDASYSAFVNHELRNTAP